MQILKRAANVNKHYIIAVLIAGITSALIIQSVHYAIIQSMLYPKIA